MGLEYICPTTLPSRQKTIPVPKAIMVFDATGDVLAPNDKFGGGLRVSGRLLTKVDGKSAVKDMDCVIWCSKEMRGSIPMKVPVMLVDASFKPGKFWRVMDVENCRNLTVLLCMQRMQNMENRCM
jgi:hypothetical protein